MPTGRPSRERARRLTETMHPPLPTPMALALAEARAAAADGEVPVGAVVTRGSGIGREVVARGRNMTRTWNDPTAHAEIVAIRAACAALGTDRLTGLDLHVTLEPCAMCAGAIAHARLARLHYGAADPKGGGVAHGARVFDHATCHHRPEVYDGIAASEAGALLREFFRERR